MKHNQPFTQKLHFIIKQLRFICYYFRFDTYGCYRRTMTFAANVGTQAMSKNFTPHQPASVFSQLIKITAEKKEMTRVVWFTTVQTVKIWSASYIYTDKLFQFIYFTRSDDLYWKICFETEMVLFSWPTRRNMKHGYMQKPADWPWLHINRPPISDFKNMLLNYDAFMVQFWLQL